jgi:hypothetical protein
VSEVISEIDDGTFVWRLFFNIYTDVVCPLNSYLNRVKGKSGN